MARNEFKDLGSVDAAESATAVDIAHLKAGTVGITVDCSTSPVWNGTWVVDMSNDGVTFVAAPTSDGGVTSTSTGNKCYKLPVAAKQVRLRCSTHVLGSASGYLSGEAL